MEATCMLKAAHLLNLIRGSQTPARKQRRSKRDMPGSRGATAEVSGRAPIRALPAWVLALDLGIALLLGAGLGLLQAKAADLAISLPPWILTLAGAAVMGALFGLTTRLILRDWTVAFRFLLSLLALLAWMTASAITYAVWAGLHPIEYLAGIDNWAKIGQLTVGCLSVLAISLVGRRAWETSPLRWVYRLRSRTPPPITKVSLKWGLGFTLAAAVVLGAALGFLQAIADRFTVPPLAVAVGGAAVMGLLAGQTVRLALRGWSEGLRIAVTLVALLVWIVEAEVTYAVTMELRPLQYLAGVDNWVEMALLTIGCLGAIVGGVGRRRTEPVRTGAVEVGPVPRRTRRPTRQARERRAISLPKFKLPSLRFRRLKPVNSSQVKVVGRAEDRCPYCLDEVRAKDPRGVVVCEICDTPHHADCWEAGGKCQIPHLTTWADFRASPEIRCSPIGAPRRQNCR
jgi:hypothetical protein